MGQWTHFNIKLRLFTAKLRLLGMSLGHHPPLGKGVHDFLSIVITSTTLVSFCIQLSAPGMVMMVENCEVLSSCTCSSYFHCSHFISWLPSFQPLNLTMKCLPVNCLRGKWGMQGAVLLMKNSAASPIQVLC